MCNSEPTASHGMCAARYPRTKLSSQPLRMDLQIWKLISAVEETRMHRVMNDDGVGSQKFCAHASVRKRTRGESRSPWAWIRLSGKISVQQVRSPHGTISAAFWRNGNSEGFPRGGGSEAAKPRRRTSRRKAGWQRRHSGNGLWRCRCIEIGYDCGNYILGFGAIEVWHGDIEACP